MADENEHDPLDALFVEDGTDTQSAPAGEDTQTGGVREEPAAGGDTQTATVGNDALGDGGGDEQPKMVPIAALDEERNKRREAEARLAERDKPAGADSQTATEDGFDMTQVFGPLPSPTEDLQGYLEGIESRRMFRDTNNHLELSERRARKEHSPEVVDKVRDWALAKFNEDPAFAQRVIFDADPYEVAIAEYNNQQEAEALKALPEEVRKGLSEEELEMIRTHRAAKTASSGEGQVADPPAQQQTRADDGKFTARSRSPAPPNSSISGLASGMKGGGDAIPTHPGAAVDSTFG